MTLYGAVDVIGAVGRMINMKKLKRRVYKNLNTSPILEKLQELEERVIQKRRRIDAEVAKQIDQIKNRG